MEGPGGRRALRKALERRMCACGRPAAPPRSCGQCHIRAKRPLPNAQRVAREAGIQVQFREPEQRAWFLKHVPWCTAATRRCPDGTPCPAWDPCRPRRPPPRLRHAAHRGPQLCEPDLQQSFPGPCPFLSACSRARPDQQRVRRSGGGRPMPAVGRGASGGRPKGGTKNRNGPTAPRSISSPEYKNRLGQIIPPSPPGSQFSVVRTWAPYAIPVSNGRGPRLLRNGDLCRPVHGKHAPGILAPKITR